MKIYRPQTIEVRNRIAEEIRGTEEIFMYVMQMNTNY